MQALLYKVHDFFFHSSGVKCVFSFYTICLQKLWHDQMFCLYKLNCVISVKQSTLMKWLFWLETENEPGYSVPSSGVLVVAEDAGGT